MITARGRKKPGQHFHYYMNWWLFHHGNNHYQSLILRERNIRWLPFSVISFVWRQIQWMLVRNYIFKCFPPLKLYTFSSFYRGCNDVVCLFSLSWKGFTVVNVLKLTLKMRRNFNRRQQTERVMRLFEDSSEFNLVVMKECKFHMERKENAELQ